MSQPLLDPTAPGGLPSHPGDRTSDRRTRTFQVLVALCVVVAVGYVAFAALTDRGSPPHRTGAGDAADMFGSGPVVAFQHVARDADYAHVSVLPLSGLDAPRQVSPLTCERVHMTERRGLCLIAEQGGLAPRAVAKIFNGSFTVLATVPLEGIPSRARVSPDGRYGATTTFVVGHSYADDSMSTSTMLLDLRTGRKIANLETFRVTGTDGQPVQARDRNLWGVTFARDSNRFYATLATGGYKYLIRGDVRARRAEVLREQVECPSLSPANNRIAYKQQTSDGWRVHVLDLTTLVEWPVSEQRSVDDQIEWLDDDHLLYGLDGDVWTVPADGGGRAEMFLPDALSPAIVR
jgi:hypothetical protein